MGPNPHTPDSLFTLLPAVQAFRGDLVVQGHLGDPVGEKTKSEGEASSLPQWMAVVSGRESRDRRQDEGDKPHTPAGPAARSCPSTVPEHPGWEWGSQKKGRGYRQRLHQAQSCTGRGLAGTRSLARALARWHQVRRGSRPLPQWGRRESSSAHSPACQRRWPLPEKYRSTLRVHPGRTRALV